MAAVSTLVRGAVSAALAVVWANACDAESGKTLTPTRSVEFGAFIVSSYAFVGPAVDHAEVQGHVSNKSQQLLGGLIVICSFGCDSGGLRTKKRSAADKAVKTRHYIAIARRDGKRVSLTDKQAQNRLARFCRKEGKRALIDPVPSRVGDALFYDGRCE